MVEYALHLLCYADFSFCALLLCGGRRFLLSMGNTKGRRVPPPGIKRLYTYLGGKLAGGDLFQVPTFLVNSCVLARGVFGEEEYRDG